ncbi:MAG: class I SAM-dependent methyltransferase [Thermomicrobiales bacterium]
MGSGKSERIAVSGVDLNAQYIEYAQERYGGAGVAFEVVDATRMSFAAQSFDRHSSSTACTTSPMT